MRVVFCGSGTFAVHSLRAILAGAHELVGIITQPPRRAGRGGFLRPTPIAEFATELSLAVNECEDINSDATVQFLQELAADVMFVAEFGQFIREPARNASRLGAFNLHASVLPELRGAAPINWAIIRGFKRTGLTTFAIVGRMDAGPIYATAETDIDPAETSDELRERLAVIGAELVCRTLDMLESGDSQPVEQNESKVTLAPKLKKADGRIDFTLPAEDVRNLIHGSWPWPGAQAILKRREGSDVRVTIARAHAEESQMQLAGGTIDGELMIATGRGRLKIDQLKPAGKRLMAWRDFVNGYHVTEGDLFVTPES